MGGTRLTTEQQAIVEVDDVPLLMRVQAFAGTGKTHTLVEFARARPGLRFLYVVFNRSMREEAAGKFPPNVTPVTSHQLAYRAIGKGYRHKLAGGLQLRAVTALLGGGVGSAEARELVAILQAFLVSAERRPCGAHLKPAQRAAAGALLPQVERLWAVMQDPTDARLPMTHDGYLKLYQLSQPDLGQQCDAILFDEAQDANPVTNALILGQRIPKVYVGDTHQQIYGFRGAVDALQELRPDVSLRLTHSFRFGPRVAEWANRLLAAYKGETQPVVGAGPDTRLGRLPEDGAPFTLLHRSFAGTFDSAVRAVRAGRGLEWVGGVEAYELTAIADLYHLAAGDYSAIDDRRLRAEYASYERYAAQAEACGDIEMKRRCRIVEQYGQELPELIRLLQQGQGRDGGSVVLSTAHRAKGMQWQRVCLADDFKNLRDPRLTGEARAQEANLLYVAITRGTHWLQVPQVVAEQLR